MSDPYKIVIIYSPPYSYLCKNCQRGEFINSKTFQNLSCICWKDCLSNEFTTCPEFLKKEE